MTEMPQMEMGTPSTATTCHPPKFARHITQEATDETTRQPR